MKKALKIIGIILIGLLLIVGLLFYFGNKKMEKNNLAEKNANYIIENLDKDEVFKEFPESNFKDREQLKNLLGGIKENCEWKNRDGKFVDFFTMKDIGGINSTAFIYEYYLKCDSLRFILIYNVDKDKPELFKMNIEPIETENKMIIFPEKQLINRK
jgi:ABC-type antimicrobial peptide transport system permease subunit